MKKKGFAILTALALAAFFAGGCSKSSDLKKVQVNEVAHSIFYAPQYAALELGYFKDEGLEVKLVNGLGADKTMTAVLSGTAEQGLVFYLKRIRISSVSVIRISDMILCQNNRLCSSSNL